MWRTHSPNDCYDEYCGRLSWCRHILRIKIVRIFFFGSLHALVLEHFFFVLVVVLRRRVAYASNTFGGLSGKRRRGAHSTPLRRFYLYKWTIY